MVYKGEILDECVKTFLPDSNGFYLVNKETYNQVLSLLNIIAFLYKLCLDAFHQLKVVDSLAELFGSRKDHDILIQHHFSLNKGWFLE